MSAAKRYCITWKLLYQVPLVHLITIPKQKSEQSYIVHKTVFKRFSIINDCKFQKMVKKRWTFLIKMNENFYKGKLSMFHSIFQLKIFLSFFWKFCLHRDKINLSCFNIVLFILWPLSSISFPPCSPPVFTVPLIWTSLMLVLGSNAPGRKTWKNE